MRIRCGPATVIGETLSPRHPPQDAGRQPLPPNPGREGGEPSSSAISQETCPRACSSCTSRKSGRTGAIRPYRLDAATRGHPAPRHPHPTAPCVAGLFFCPPAYALTTHPPRAPAGRLPPPPARPERAFPTPSDSMRFHLPCRRPQSIIRNRNREPPDYQERPVGNPAPAAPNRPNEVLR